MTTLERVRAEIQKVLDKERDFTSESAKAQALALFWVLELFDKYAEQEPTDDDKIYCNRDLCVAMEYNKLGCKACPANHDEIQADYDRQKASGMTDEEWEYGKAEQAEDVYDKVLAYLKANVDDFPDYHEAIEAVLKMKGGE